MNITPDSKAYTILLAGIAALPPLCIDMNLPAIPSIESAFGVAPGRGALTFSLFLLGFSLSPIIGGPLADRYGRKPTLTVSLLAATLAAFACMLDGSFHFLLASRLVQGIAAGVCILIPLAIIRDTLSGAEARSRLSGIMLIVGVAPLLAPVIGGSVLAVSGWRAIYGIQGGLGAVLLFFVATGVSETLPQDRRRPFNMNQLVSGYKSILTDRNFLSLALPIAFGFGCMFSYIAGSPGFLVGKMHLSEQTYSIVFAGTSFGLMLGSMVSRIMSRWEIHPRPIISAGLALMIATAGTILLLIWKGEPSLLVLLPLLLLNMLCFGMMQPNAMSEAVNPWQKMAGTASGAVNSLQMLVGAGASALVTALAGIIDPGLTMGIAMFCSVVLAGVLYWGLRPGSRELRFEQNENSAS
ncbi:multidrug effflux MFS transporter [Maridesulfovibrio sp.]|uniref:multidrug effflux MFS transporter n=1 Tax=Maridesulfovibrio sp. TaxID=2795000 RepID=UPI002A187C6E|nr:multidrug effflux MFS transporter [Maridesulfovibrio sp.]